MSAQTASTACETKLDDVAGRERLAQEVHVAQRLGHIERRRARNEGEGYAAFEQAGGDVEGLAADDVDIEQGAGPALRHLAARGLDRGNDLENGVVAQFFGDGELDVHRNKRVVFDDQDTDIRHQSVLF